MKFSVVIPAYNSSESIGRAILSCLRQTLKPFEIIVVADGCTDDTENLVQANFPSVKLFSLPENKGVSFARNWGLKQAQSEWIAFLDADDEWLPQKLEILAALIPSKPKAAGWIHGFSTEKTNDVPVSPAHPKRVSFFKILLRNHAQGSSICLKKEAGFLFNEQFRYCEDHELALRIARKKQLFAVSNCLTLLGRAQLSKGGLSGNKLAMRKGELKMYSGIGKFNPLFIVLIPFLWIFSLSKHLLKQC